MSREKYGIWQKYTEASGQLDYQLRVFGDFLARRENYQEHEGIDAVHFYLCTKYQWLPSLVKSMSQDDLRFMLAEEMYDWKLPPEAL